MILYSNDCPKCKILQSKLEAKNISYEKKFDKKEIMRLGFMSVPILVDGETAMAFSEANKYINDL